MFGCQGIIGVQKAHIAIILVALQVVQDRGLMSAKAE